VAAALGRHAAAKRLSFRPRIDWPVALALIVALAGYALLATVAPPWDFDFISDWGLKGRVFWESGGLDLTYLAQTLGRGTHADYPPLLPLSFDVVAVIGGDWNDRWLGLLNVAWAAALLLLVARVAKEETGSSIGAALIVI